MKLCIIYLYKVIKYINYFGVFFNGKKIANLPVKFILVVINWRKTKKVREIYKNNLLIIASIIYNLLRANIIFKRIY